MDAKAQKAEQARQLKEAAKELAARKAAGKAAAKAAKGKDVAKVEPEAKVEAKKPTRAEITEAKEKLAQIKVETNARIERSEKALGQSENLLLSAAEVLKDAEGHCKIIGTPFKQWCEKNITHIKWDTARKYLAFAKEPNPVKALEDYRAGAAKRNKELRQRKKAGAPAAPGAHTPAAPRPRQATGVDALKIAMVELPLKDQVVFVRWAAEQVGYILVDKLAAAAEVRETVHSGPVGVAADDGSDAPAHLTAGNKRLRRTAPVDAAH
jgi:hypothetical protein